MQKTNSRKHTLLSKTFQTRSTSFVYEPIQECEDQYTNNETQTYFKSQTSIDLIPRPKIEIYKESCTQTSKTVIILDDNSANSLSPDSLSPKSTPHLTVFEATSTLSVEDFLSEKTSIKELLTGNALTQTYLAKYGRKFKKGMSWETVNRLGNKDVINKSEEEPKTKRSPRTVNKVAVKSTHKQIRKTPLSFMSPTISSESKDQKIIIDTISKLISPTRRGRSSSPSNIEKCQKQPNQFQSKVPYIDKSDITIKLSLDYTDKKSNSKKSYDDITFDSTSRMETCSSLNSTECVLNTALSKLKDIDWHIALVGLAEIVEICRVMDVDSIFPHMTIINQRLIELMKCPRSHVVRTACQAVGPIFEYVKDTRRPEFDEIVDILLHKTADSNKYIRHDANLALDCMVTHIPTFHAVRVLCSKGPNHKNALVRTATARLMVCAIVIAGPQSILSPQSNEYTRKRIAINLVKFLDDKCQEVRKFGERIYKLLCKDRIFELYLRRYLEPEIVVKMRNCILANNGHRL